MTMSKLLMLARQNVNATDEDIADIRAFGDIWYKEIFTELEDLEIRIVDKGEYLKGEVLA